MGKVFLVGLRLVILPFCVCWVVVVVAVFEAS